jgi:hypothetical protein
MTPTAEPSAPAGRRALPDVVIWSVIVALLILSIVLPAVMGGGWMWLLTAVMLPLLSAWAGMQWMLRTRQLRLGGRALALIIVCTALSVAAFCAVVAFAFQH